MAEIYPYLISKKKQALVAWNLLEFVQDGKKLGKCLQASEIREKRALLTMVLSDLNQCRPVDIPGWCKEPPSMHEPGWYLRSDIIWSKPNPMPESVTDRPTKAHEYIFLLSKSPHYYYDHEAIREKAIYGNTPTGVGFGHGTDKEIRNRERVRTDKQRGHGRRHAGFNDRWDRMTKEEQCSMGRNKRTVWTVSTKPYPEAHFATFPPELIVPCILAGCPEGGTVLDPFVGSGTTMEVAARLGRHSIGIELNPDYVPLIDKRIKPYRDQVGLWDKENEKAVSI